MESHSRKCRNSDWLAGIQTAVTTLLWDVVPFFQVKAFLNLSDNEITKKPSNIWPVRHSTTFWLLLVKAHNVIEHHIPVRLKIVAKLPS